MVLAKTAFSNLISSIIIIISNAAVLHSPPSILRVVLGVSKRSRRPDGLVLDFFFSFLSRPPTFQFDPSSILDFISVTLIQIICVFVSSLIEHSPTRSLGGPTGMITMTTSRHFFYSTSEYTKANTPPMWLCTVHMCIITVSPNVSPPPLRCSPTRFFVVLFC